MEGEEMSGRFLSSGRELTVRELAEFRRRSREQEAEKWLAGSGFKWFAYALGLPLDFDLYSLIRTAEVDGTSALYHKPRLRKKADGGTRIIIVPKPELMFLQKRINRLLQETFPRPQNVFGYRGGSCLELVQRHAAWPSTLKFDIKDAFFQVSWGKAYAAILKPKYQEGKQGFSGPVARWIAKLCTYSPPPKIVEERFGSRACRSFLPQGAPTSSILFDLACWRADEKLERVAERVGGIVSRYADNYYFSMKTSRISPKLIRLVINDVRKRGFPVHKIRRVDQGELCRMLGYNSLNGKVTNTRDFNRRLRGALYVLRTKLDRGLPWQEDWARVKGFAGFSVNIPSRLKEEYVLCEQKIDALEAQQAGSP